MKVKFADRVHGATTHVTRYTCGGCTTEKFNPVHAADAKPERKLPGGVSGWLAGYGLHVDNLYASRGRLTRQEVDAHLAARNTKLADRMSVKSVLARHGLMD